MFVKNIVLNTKEATLNLYYFAWVGLHRVVCSTG